MKQRAQPRLNTHLKRQREQKQWTQTELARMVDTTHVNVSRWENGTTTPSLYYRRKLCELFGKRPEELGFTALSEEANQGGEHLPSSLTSWNIPYRRNLFFTGREAVLTHLHDTLHSGKTAALTQAQAICGLGGIGKTQTAVEYAYRFRDDYSAILWVQAETYETLFNDFVTLASVLDLPEKSEQDQNRIVEAVKRWLNEFTNWLLILDNVEDFAMVGKFLPLESKGHLVLTTRSQSTGIFARNINLEQMESAEGALFLLRRAKLLESDALLANASESLCLEATSISLLLAGLPLALDQAGAYIEETGCNLLDYLDRYQTQRARLLGRRGSSIAEYPESVSTIFTLSLEKVESANPIAAELLRLCAFLSADDIPEEIVTEGSLELGPILYPIATDLLTLDDAFAVLRKYSLLHRNAETKTFTIHRLVQATLKEEMDEAKQRSWAERTVRIVNSVFPKGEEVANWPCCQHYLSHAEVCAQLIAQWKMVSPEAGRLLYQMGVYLMERALYVQAEDFLGKARNIRIQVLEPMHPDTVESLNTLAVLYGNKGDYAQAEPLFQQVLDIRQHVLGPNHLNVGESLNDLALLYYHQGKYAQAEPLYQQSLSASKLNLGETHHYVGVVLNNLAMLYRDWSKYTQAEPLFQQALAIYEKQLTAEHPDVATILNNLALLYVKQGKYKQAELLCRRTLKVLESTLGDEHPRTTQSLSVLAMLYVEQGQYELAELLYLRSLLIREKVLGAEHPRTIQNLNSLAKLYGKQGRYDEAELYYQQILAIQEKTLEPEHADVLTTLNDYTTLLFEAGREAEAATMEARIKKIRMKQVQ